MLNRFFCKTLAALSIFVGLSCLALANSSGAEASISEKMIFEFPGEEPELQESQLVGEEPFWKRWWFILLEFIVVASVIIVFEQIRVRRLLEIERIRARIATDLHDDIGSGLTHIGLLSEITLKKMAKAEGDLSKNEIQDAVLRMGEAARELSQAMSDVVWSINPRHDSVAALQHRLAAFAYDVCLAKGIKLTLDVDQELAAKSLDPEKRQNLLLIAKEAVHNAAKYSESPSMTVTLVRQKSNIVLRVTDEGRGFDAKNPREGNGLYNMRARAEKLGGRCEIVSRTGEGAQVTVVAPFTN